MERCSYFIEDKALFGSFPTQEEVLFLENLGVRYFIDLTNTAESKTTPYKTNYKYIKYPIMDRKIPQDWKSFAQLVIEISYLVRDVKDGEKLYVHCKGGHGRSGILVACILCYYYNLSPENALKQTNKCHAARPEMRDKWRKLGSPQGKKQKDFVHRFFRPLRYGRTESGNFTPFQFSRIFFFTKGLSNLTNHRVMIPGVGIFPNAHLAFQSFRAPRNSSYVKKLEEGKFCPELIGNTHVKNWEEKKVDYMYRTLGYKFRQHEDLKRNLMNTGLRPLVKISRDSFWGEGESGKGKNMTGKLLDKLRAVFLGEDFRGSLNHNSPNHNSLNHGSSTWLMARLREIRQNSKRRRS